MSSLQHAPVFLESLLDDQHSGFLNGFSERKWTQLKGVGIDRDGRSGSLVLINEYLSLPPEFLVQNHDAECRKYRVPKVS